LPNSPDALNSRLAEQKSDRRSQTTRQKNCAANDPSIMDTLGWLLIEEEKLVGLTYCRPPEAAYPNV
jgi:hypothetical protein